MKRKLSLHVFEHIGAYAEWRTAENQKCDVASCWESWMGRDDVEDLIGSGYQGMVQKWFVQLDYNLHETENFGNIRQNLRWTPTGYQPMDHDDEESSQYTGPVR